MIKSPGEMHFFLECFSSDELYECVRNNTNGRVPRLVFSNAYLCFIFLFLSFYFWGMVSGDCNLDWDFQFKKGAVILSFV